MNENFKLNTIPYKRITIEELTKDYEKIIKEFKEADSGEKQFEVHKKFYALENKINTTLILAHLRHYGNVADKFYADEENYYNEISPQIIDLSNKYKKELVESRYRNYLENKIGKIAFKDYEFELKSFDSALIPLKQKENILTFTYSKLLAELKINFRNEEFNLSLLGKYLKDKDRDTRIEAVKARNEALENIKPQLDDIYDKLVKNRDAQAKVLGFKNYVELGYYLMGRTTYGLEEVREFKKQVKEYLVPFAEKLHEKRKNRLKLDTLDSVDDNVYFDYGNPAPAGTADDIFKAGQKMYSELSPETNEFFNFMLEHDLFDVLARPNKAGGGYMDMLAEYKAPFIYANFNGTSGDIDVITHESGHAFQGYLTRNYEISEHNAIKMETAETHSMSMEFFTDKWMNLFFGDKADDFLTMQLEDAICFIPYGTMVDEFQEQVYLHPEYTPAERNKLWSALEKEFQPHLKFKYDKFRGEGRRWQLQHHIYESPFYYIDYCLAETCALRFKILMSENFEDAWKKYLDFSKQSATDTFQNMLNNAGIISPFEKGSIKDLVEKLEKFV